MKTLWSITNKGSMYGSVTCPPLSDGYTYQIWLHFVSQGKGQPHGVQGGEHRGEPGLLNLPASGNAVNVVFGKLEGKSKNPNQLGH